MKNDIYMTGSGALDIAPEGGPITFIGASGRIDIPADVQARARRLQVRSGRRWDHWEHMAEWGNRELWKAYEAGLKAA